MAAEKPKPEFPDIRQSGTTGSPIDDTLPSNLELVKNWVR